MRQNTAQPVDTYAESRKQDAARTAFYGELSEEEQALRGEAIAKALYLRRDPEHKDRYLTGWGTKTALGLFRTVQSVLEGRI